PVHSSGGERSSPSQGKRRGIVAPSKRALEPSRMDRLHRYGAAGRVHLCRAKDWCCPNSIEAVRIATLLAERRAQNLGQNNQHLSRFFQQQRRPLCRQKMRAVHMPELLICRNGTNSSEIVREIVGAQFRCLRHTLRFARVRWTTLACVEKVRPQFLPPPVSL